MGKPTLIALGGGGLSGAAVIAALTGSPIGVVLVYLAPLPLLMVGLCYGSGAFGLAAAAGLLLVLLMGGFTAGGLFGGMHVIPSWLIIQQALRPNAASADGWQPIGHILAVLALLVTLVLMATALGGQNGDGIQALVAETLATVAEMAAPGLDQPERAALVTRLAPMFLGFSAVAWLCMLVVNAGLAQSFLGARGLSRRSTPRWSDIRVPAWFDWVLAGMALAGLATSGDVAYLARNAVIILLAPYFFVGLAVVHKLARRAPMPGMVLAIFYFLLLLFFLFAAAAVAAIGLADQWLGVRNRLPAAGPRSPKA